MTPGRADASLSGRRFALALAAIALLAFVVPPFLARLVQARRVSRATAQVEATARAMAVAGLSRLLDNPAIHEIGVLTGPGDPPTGAADQAWTAARHAALPSFLTMSPPAEPDPWLRALQVNIGASRGGGRVVVLSAGPNGNVDTPFDATRAGGDDIIAPLP